MSPTKQMASAFASRITGRFTLLSRFTVISLTVTMFIALGFGWVLSRQIIEDALDEAALEAAGAATAVITPQVGPRDFRSPTPTTVAAWKQRVAQIVGGMDIVRIKVWNPQGQVVYSDETDLIGRTYPLAEEEELKEALAGHVAKELSGLEKSENEKERSYGRLLEVYVPVVLPGTSQVAGVYEVYRSFLPLQAKIGKIKRLVWGGTAAAFSLLYASLYVLVSRASRRMSWQQKELLAREAAERANQAKSEFLSRMSHELRTPLNAILGFAQLLEMDSLSEEQSKYVRHILTAGRHLFDLINEVLDIARIEAGRLSISLEPVSAGELVRESLDLVAPLAVEKAVNLHVKVTEAFERFVMADRQRLRQVLLNLLSNAIKYNRIGGEVDLAAELVSDRRLRIVVDDTGPGIAPDKMERLFTPFERLGAEETAVEGAGLGLAVSRRLMEAMIGRIGVESRLGKGSSFWVELPTVGGPPAAVETARSQSKGPT